LASGEQPDSGGEPVFQPEFEDLEFFPEDFPALSGDTQPQSAFAVAGVGDREVLLDSQMGCGAGHRILEDPAHLLGHLVVGQLGDV